MILITIQIQDTFRFNSAVHYVIISNSFILLLHVRTYHCVLWLQTNSPLGDKELCITA